MQKSPLNAKYAFILSLSISLLINILFFVVFLYRKDAFHPAEGHPMPPDLNWEMIAFHVLFNFIYAYILYSLCFYLFKKNFGKPYYWLIVILTIFVVATVLSYAFSVAKMLYFEFGHHLPFHRFLASLLGDYFIMIVVILSSQLLSVSYFRQQAILENKMLVMENIRSRFQALKNQMDPHFLFNSLNTLNSLIRLDGEKAQEYVQQLSSVLRYTLQSKEVISLEEELQFTRSYCHLMQIRYGDCLQFDCDIDEHYSLYQIIPLSLQVLVENAIKHNVISKKQVLKITISSHLKPGFITVCNPISPKKELEKGEGIGLTNLSERYRLMWNIDIEIKNENGLFQVSVPLTKNENESFNY